MKNKNNFKLKHFVFVFIIGAFIFCFGIGVGYFANLVKNQPVITKKQMKNKIQHISANSEIYFNDGTKAGIIDSALMRKTITYKEMGDNIKNAIIASEDANFYNNSGVEPFSILRAGISQMAGKNTTGGSTITQQLVKNTLLDSSRTYERKAKEILLAYKVNNNFSKEEILESYLNVATFGRNKLGKNISGIETAAMGIFGVHSKDLNIAQAAYLAGFVQSPYLYTPFNLGGELRSDKELQAGFNRQKYVLERMYDNNLITKDEYEKAKKFDIKKSFIKEMKDTYADYPYIRDEVINSASEIFAKEIAEKENSLEKFKNDVSYRKELIEKGRTKFLDGGYKVKVTIDKKLYDALNKAKLDFKNNPKYRYGNKVYDMETGAVLIENKTGRVLAFIGGMDYNKQQLNHATRTTRSPGSTIKPLLVYAPAMDKGYITPNSYVLDRRFNYNGWKPENFAKTQKKLVSVRYALAQSLNLPTIRLYSAFLDENPMHEYFDKMNFSRLVEADYKTYAASIGGLAYGVNVLENTNAFATLANEGKYKQAYIIDEIKNGAGEIVYQADFDDVDVYKKETSYLMVKVLNDVISGVGTAPDIARNLKFNSKNLFVKTGTSEYNHDLWVIGGSENVTFGLWTGYDKPYSMPGYYFAHNQWARFMNVINNYDKKIINADKDFKKPATIESKRISPYNNNVGGVLDLVPKGFKMISPDKMNKKFGINIDKDTIKKLHSKTEEEEKEEKEKKEKKEKEKKEKEKRKKAEESKKTKRKPKQDEEETNEE